MNQTYKITVNDSALSTKRWGLHAALLFMACYALEFLAYCLIDHVFRINNYYAEEYMPEGAGVDPDAPRKKAATRPDSAGV